MINDNTTILATSSVYYNQTTFIYYTTINMILKNRMIIHIKKHKTIY